MRSRHALSCFASLVAFALVGCGRTPLDVPEGDGAVAVDVPLDRPDTPPTDRPCMANADCNDNLVCNGEERCVGGFCQAGTPINCDDGVGCTVDLCDESTRACVNRPDNTRCTAPATCDPSRDCTAVPCTTAADCDDGDPCTGAESCAAGRCVRGVPLRCDDGVDCTADSCVPRVGCQSRADDTRCSDGVFCNGVETCGPRGCQRGAPLACGGTMCSPTRCDEATRACVPVSADRDGDGETPTACGGTDCDDNDRTVGRRAPEQCANGRDDNCDGRADCADLLCARAPNCGPCTPTGPEVCADGVDNDCNGAVDCVDAECRATPVCGMCVPTGPETGPVACGDGRDNDCDSRVDCASPGCAMEPRCFMCVPTGPEGAACVDGRDNDCNGQIDCADPACAMQPGCRADNDRCETAAPLLLPGAVSGNTTAARDDYMPGCAAEGGPDVAYVLRNPRTQTVTLDVESATFDAVLHVFRENCGGMALACNDDAVGLNPRLVLRDLAPGTYFVVVDGFGASRGSFRLRASVGTTEVCGNGQDDDGNGLVDCRDPACAMLPECRMCQPTGPEGGRGCLDGVDNDCNGRTDCDDPACASFPQCCRPERPEADPMACLDGRDNDCNGRVDCDDPGCAATGVCCMPTGPENTDAACSDGRDNDCDGRADCADPDCAGRGRCACVALPEQCGNGRDDDCDRLVDCADPDCAPDPVCTPMGPANDVCAGAAPLAVPATVRGTTVGARNDYTPVVMGFPGCGGGAGPDVVYAFTVLRATPLVVEVTGEGFDPVVYVRRGDCTGGPQTACNDDFQGLNSRATFTAAPGTYFVVVDGFGGGDQGAFTLRVSVGAPPAEVCDNRLDDDGDRLVDCADPDCAMNPACRCVPTGPENNPVACADGRDNDCDGLSDCAAPGCRLTPACCRPTAQREFGVAACTDGLDNDCDGVADCADSDCRPSREPDGECCNGRDDNGNTVIDEFACACETNAQCVGVGNGGPFPSNACWATTFRLCAPRCTLLGGDRFCREQFGPAARCDVNSGECR